MTVLVGSINVTAARWTCNILDMTLSNVLHHVTGDVVPEPSSALACGVVSLWNPLVQGFHPENVAKAPFDVQMLLLMRLSSTQSIERPCWNKLVHSSGI